METKRLAMFPALAIGLLLAGSAAIACADTDIRIAGFADALPLGPGGALTLPLVAGAKPVDLGVSLGVPSLQLLVQITPATVIEAESGLPVTLTDGDRVKVEAMLVGNVLQASKLEVDRFPEVELIGTASGIPAAVRLPLPAAETLDFVVSLGVPPGDVRVQLTSTTRVEGGSSTLFTGAAVQVAGIVQNFEVVATEISVKMRDVVR